MKTNHLITLTCLTIVGFLGCSKPTKSTTDAKNQAEAGGTKIRDNVIPNIEDGKPLPQKSSTDAKNQAETGGIKTRDNVIPNIEDGKPIELPANYRNQFPSSLKSIVLVNLPKIEIKAGQVLKGLEKELGRELEVKLSQLRRFNITQQKPDLIFDCIFQCTILLSKREFERADGTDRVFYKVDVLLEMKNTRGQMMARPISFTGKTEEMKIIVGLDGKRIGGVTLENETQAIRDAITDCVARISIALVRQFPITAQVVGISSFDTDRMLLDMGVMQGLVKGQLVVIWTSDGGIDIPLAEARVSPGENNSSIQITRWNVSSPGIKNFIKKIKSPGWLKQEGNKLFATTAGLPLPPEWKRKK